MLYFLFIIRRDRKSNIKIEIDSDSLVSVICSVLCFSYFMVRVGCVFLSNDWI